MANVMLELLDGFSLVLVLMYRYSISTFNKWLKILNMRKWILVVDILIQILLTLLTSIALQFCEKYQFVVDGFS